MLFVGCCSIQDASHDQDYYVFLGSGGLELNLHLPLAPWQG